MTLKDLLLGGSGGLFALLTILQISPIKINPWSALARSIGRALNKDVLDRLTTLEVEQKEIKSELAAQKALSDKREANGWGEPTSSASTWSLSSIRGTRGRTTSRFWTSSTSTKNTATATRTTKTTVPSMQSPMLSAATTTG